MSEGVKDINTVEVLMSIKEDVSVIKNEMQHIKDEMQEFKRESMETNSSLKKRISKLESDVEELKGKETLEDAKKYRKVVQLILTALSGAVVAKMPDFIRLLISRFTEGGK